MFSLKRTKEWSSFSWEVYGLNQEHGGNETKIERRGDAHIQELYPASKILLEVS